MTIGPPQVIAEATCCAELVDAFRARKVALNLSNEAIDHIIPLASGHTDKIIGPSQARGLSQISLDGMLSALGLKLLVAIDPDQVARMKPRWEDRDIKQIRPSRKLAKAIIARARPLVLRELGRRAAAARWARTPPGELRSALMREVARARWGARKHASAPVPQQETAR